MDGTPCITQHGKGTVVKMTPRGEIPQEIDALGTHPSNLCFGGSYGWTVYVTGAGPARFMAFRVDRPGMDWQRWRENASAEAPAGEVDLSLVAGQSKAVAFGGIPSDAEGMFRWLTALPAMNTRSGLGKNTHMSAIVKARKAVDAADPLAVHVDTVTTVINAAHYHARGTLDIGEWLAEALARPESASAR